MGHQALCGVLHREDISSEGVSDGAGISADLSLALFSRLTKNALTFGSFGVGNFFVLADPQQRD